MAKNRKIRKVLAILCAIFCINTNTSYASIAQNYNFKNITIEDGLSQSTIKSMHQDKKGYIWIGTDDGINRYNGYEFKQYKHSEDNPNSINSNYIIDIKEDDKGYIWVSTTNGLSRINTTTDKIKNYYSKEYDGNLVNGNLWRLLYTKEGKLIVFSVNGVNLYDEKRDTFNIVDLPKHMVSSQYIYSAEEDSNGHIWVGTDVGLFQLDNNLSLVKYYEDSIGNVEVYRIYEDLNKNLWICTLGKGIFKINLNNKSIKNYRHSSSANSIASDDVRDITVDSNGDIWVGTNKGICYFDYETEKFITYNAKAHDSNSLVNDSILCLLTDESGLIWIGTHNGISTFSPDNKFAHFKSDPYDDKSISGDLIYGIYEDEDKLLWVGTANNGINIIKGKDIKFLTEKNSNLLSNTIHDITGYKNKIFIGTSEGLSVLTKNDGDYTITNYTEEDNLPSNVITYLFVDSNGNLLIGTNKGIAVLDSNNKIKNISYIFDEIGITDKFIGGIYEDSRGNYYIGCFLDGGLIKFDAKTKEHTVYKNIKDDKSSISSNGIIFISEDLDRNILVGTAYGLNILEPNKNTFRRYTEKEGLINNTVYGVLVDNDNNIWISTNGGISKLLSSRDTFENFTVVDGLQSNEFNGRACFKSSDGMMYFGGIKGFSVFNPMNIKGSEFVPKVTFDNFEVNGVNKKDISNYRLKYNENTIKVSFFSDDYVNVKSTQYYYKLEGLYNHWRTTKNNSIVFANLSGGDYKLRVRAKTKDGLVGEESVVNFTIDPPFWKSDIAMLGYILVICGFILANRNKVKKLDKLVNEKTHKLQVQMDKNEELFDKIITLEKNKNNYFVNLSHELRTPLNVLTSINQLIKNTYSKDNPINIEKLPYYVDMMERNTNRLLTLINNLIDNTKIENNSYVLTKEDIDIVYLVEETVMDMKDYIEGNGIEFVFDTDVEEKIINCDKTEIERCIINLVGNAVKFTDEGGLIEVVITDLNDIVKISVKDNGIGINEENKKFIFDRFNQVIDENAELKGGSGLGLTICKQLITLHGGEIYVKSKVGVGSEFVIILPVGND